MTLRGFFRVFSLLSLLGLWCVAACRDAPPTAPAASDSVAVSLPATPVAWAVEDARLRILPVLGDSVSTAALDLALRQFGAALGQPTAAVPAAAERVESALAALEASAGPARDGLAPEFEVIRIVIADARARVEQNGTAR